MGGGWDDDGFEFVEEVERDEQPAREDMELDLVVVSPIAASAAAPSREACALFSLIEVKSDKQELSFVEKVLLSESQIFELFNKLAPGSVRVEDQRWFLDTGLLEAVSLETVGFYGSKGLMVDIFAREKAFVEEDIAKLRSDQLPAGLYGALHGRKLLIFYWQPSKKFTDARRSDISCNFIRYLVELCDVVYSCIELENGGASMASIGTSSSKRKRTQRLQVSMVKSSDNDFNVRRGFRLPAGGGASRLSPRKLSEGFYRTGLLETEKYTPKESFSHDHATVPPEKLGEVVKSWGDVQIDYTEMKDEDFILFCQSAMPDSGQELREALATLDDKISAAGSEFSSTEELFNKEKEEVLSVFARGLNAYLRLACPWEEKLLLGGGEQRACTGSVDFIKYHEGWNEQSIEADEKALSEMEAKLLEVLAADKKEKVFIGSKVSVQGFSGFFVIAREGKRLSGPMTYGETFTAIRGHSRVEARLLTRNGGPEVVSSDNFDLFAGKKLVARNTRFRSVDHPSGDHFRQWLGFCAEEVGLMLKKKIQLAASLKDQVDATEDYLLQCILADCLDEVGNVDFAKKLKELQGREVEDPSLSDSVRSLCMGAYVMRRQQFMGIFLDLVEDSLFHILKSKVKLELEAQHKARVESLKQKKSDVASAYKMKLSQSDGEALPKIKIKSCRPTSGGSSWRVFSLLKGDVPKISISFLRQQTHSERIIWKVVEFLPQKKELELQAAKSEHIIVPSSSGLQTIADIDSQEYTLSNVILLKSGQVLLFVKGVVESCMAIYLCQSLGSRIRIPEREPMKVLKRGFDLAAFDEASNFIAFYEQSLAAIKIFRFTDGFRELFWTGVDIELDKYHGSTTITGLHFVPSRAELLLFDATGCVRVFEVAQPAMMKPRTIQLLDSFLKACVTPDVTLSDICVSSVHQLEAQVVLFGSQTHLLVLDDEKNVLHSVVLDVTLASQTCQIRLRDKCDSAEETPMSTSVCYEVDYLYHIFDKYAVSPPLLRASPRCITFRMVVRVLNGSHDGNDAEVVKHAKMVLDKLRREKGKEVLNVDISFEAEHFDRKLEVRTSRRCLGDFLRRLSCLVPVQIARAENNSLRPLINGMRMAADVNYADSISLAEIVRFGLYDAVIQSWNGPVKVISSMGKQSSGKSYLLNHLSGSLLDVAGGRCTDGVWMTTCTAEDCLYVILDFEGLGSFERSEQEDMLLSILNAAVSNITVFNKKDFHLDKETEALFDRFQAGVSLVKQDEKLFKECMVGKWRYALCHLSTVASSTKASPRLLEELEPVHTNGKSFLRDLKLIIAQISSKDWSPIDSKRIAFKLTMLAKNLRSAVVQGCMEDGKPLVNFDTEEQIDDAALGIEGLAFSVEDAGLRLGCYGDLDLSRAVLEQLLGEFEKVMPRTGKGDEEWHRKAEIFLVELVERRKDRVTKWIGSNTAAFATEGDVQKLVLEAAAMISGMKESLALCSCKCTRCFLRCSLEKSHKSSHSCNGNHRCSEFCTYCVEEGTSSASHCADVAGHEGSHDCKLKSHTCGHECELLGASSNCNKVCSRKVGHPGEHKCNSRQHMCKEKCQLPGCDNICVSPSELDHKLHACHEKMCPTPCCMPGCHRKCATADHFHSMKSGIQHFCESEHPCQEACQSPGICDVVTEVVKKTKTFVGKRSQFEYEHVSEQNGVRKGCCVPVPAFNNTHAGPHIHTTNPSAIHFCPVRCQGCGYFCNLAIGHRGLHDTTHGNMTDKFFASETEEVDILDRKYSWGESGAAEMCMMHCKARGRGHVHLAVCERNKSVFGVCKAISIPDGARHETKKYGPDFGVAKDELTHAAYWKNMRFKDPCSDEDQRLFALCAHSCASSEHRGDGANEQRSYCTEKLWHAPVSSMSGVAGYVSEDGHVFVCKHLRDAANHVVFVIDKSGSMGSPDAKPRMASFPPSRLGCVYEAMVRFIRTRQAAGIRDFMSVVLFESSAVIAMEKVAMAESQVYALLGHDSSGGTVYSAGLQLAEEILGRSAGDAKAPAIIFLSDGGNAGGSDPVAFVRKIKSMEPRLVVHTIVFGSDLSPRKVLVDMAREGGGVFQITNWTVSFLCLIILIFAILEICDIDQADLRYLLSWYPRHVHMRGNICPGEVMSY
ncbi:hypothetical protein SELMODRAFT_408444 [Selaginella moellendorffii]|uniref:VWFA domain-containing protein n=1 Tax=Selaginella moellendorffii TaxID=88036 RepID=D8R8B2_SELML|nr:hypothetical protein SELMODRAFT_408444 [Selaginella moellendorffii]